MQQTCTDSYCTVLRREGGCLIGLYQARKHNQCTVAHPTSRASRPKLIRTPETPNRSPGVMGYSRNELYGTFWDHCTRPQTNAYQCIPMHTNAHQCTPMHTNAHQCRQEQKYGRPRQPRRGRATPQILNATCHLLESNLQSARDQAKSGRSRRTRATRPPRRRTSHETLHTPGVVLVATSLSPYKIAGMGPRGWRENRASLQHGP